LGTIRCAYISLGAIRSHRPRPPSPSLVDQAVRGAGLSANALAHGVTGAINLIPDAMTSAYNFARNPHMPSWKEINPFSGEAWPSNTPSAYV